MPFFVSRSQLDVKQAAATREIKLCTKLCFKPLASAVSGFFSSVSGTPALIGSCPSALSNSDMGMCITNEENEAQACPICLSAWESELTLDPPGGVHAPVQTRYFKNVDGTSQRAKEHKPSYCGKVVRGIHSPHTGPRLGELI